MKRLTILDYQAVARLLAAGRRHVEIARELDLSVDTIDRIADDRLRGREPPSEDELPEDDAPPGYIARNLRRCSGCGAMVYLWPCLACSLGANVQPVVPVEEEEDDDDELPDIFAQIDPMFSDAIRRAS